MDNQEFMEQALAQAKLALNKNEVPIGAIAVLNNQIISMGHNSMISNLDPTAHAEVSVIRLAAKKLGTFDLSGCEIYTSCEPCPMCFGAVYWARLEKLYFANNKSDAKKIGFDDSFIYDEINLSHNQRKIPNIQLLRDEALKAFKDWEEKEDKIEY